MAWMAEVITWKEMNLIKENCYIFCASVAHKVIAAYKNAFFKMRLFKQKLLSELFLVNKIF
jgi:hypothetical protein